MWRTCFSVAPPIMLRSLHLLKRHLAMKIMRSLVPMSSSAHTLPTIGKCRKQHLPGFWEVPVPPQPQRNWRTLLFLLQSNSKAEQGLGSPSRTGFLAVAALMWPQLSLCLLASQAQDKQPSQDKDDLCLFTPLNHTHLQNIFLQACRTH